MGKRLVSGIYKKKKSDKSKREQPPSWWFLMETNGEQAGGSEPRTWRGPWGGWQAAPKACSASQASEKKKPRRTLHVPTWRRGEDLPSETRSLQVSPITFQYSVLWGRSNNSHSSWVKVTSTSLKVTGAWKIKHSGIICFTAVRQDQSL